MHHTIFLKKASVELIYALFSFGTHHFSFHIITMISSFHLFDAGESNMSSKTSWIAETAEAIQ
jgi:hypothetical protein